MTDYAASNGCGLDLKDSLTRSGWKPLDPVNTTDALLSADFIVFGKLQFAYSNRFRVSLLLLLQPKDHVVLNYNFHIDEKHSTSLY